MHRRLSDPATESGFAAGLWSAPRLAWLIEKVFAVHFHPDYLTSAARPCAQSRGAMAPRTRRRGPCPVVGTRLAAN